MDQDLIKLDHHFAFGKNWASYAQGVGESEIEEAQASLKRLLGDADLKGQRFLDIGCGSGIHSLAALRLGASEVLSVDLDPDSVATTQAVLDRFAKGQRYSVRKVSVFDLDPAELGKFDVVYSWGVLHHTGNMDGAVRKAAQMVNARGLFLFALYRRTWMCPFWKLEKKWYTTASVAAQQRAMSIYTFFFRLGLRATSRNPDQYITNYSTNRGMKFMHDVHDWLGGYPYESILPDQVEELMKEIGFSGVRSFPASRRRKPTGIFGSGCDEYVFRKG